MPGGQRLHHFAQIGDQGVEMVRVAGQRVGERLKVDRERRKIGCRGIHVLTATGGRLAERVDHNIELVAHLGVQRVQHLVDLDRRQRMALVNRSAVGDGALGLVAAVDLDVGLAQEVLLPDHGSRILEERREIAMQEHGYSRASRRRRQALDFADA